MEIERGVLRHLDKGAGTGEFGPRNAQRATRNELALSFDVERCALSVAPINSSFPHFAFKKIIALVTIVVFMWSMCVTPVRAEVINLEGGSVDVNVQDNITNWNVTGNPIWNMPEFNVAEGSIYNIAGLGTGSSLAVLVNGGSASNIFGTMNLFNLDFILQNIAGINIGSSAMINLNSASLIASTLPLNLNATDFLNRQYAFSGQGGFLMNEGRIIGDNADLVALVANAIENRGVIEVPMGTAALAAGDTVTVGISPDGMVTIGVDAATANELGLADQIKNSGTISAQGGRVVLNAKAIDGLFDKAIHIDASENATAVIVSDDGVIEFVAEGDITNTGTLQAKRGSITIEATGDVETLGVLRAKTLTESAASFHIGGVYSVGSSSHDNLDNAITFSASTTLEGDEDGSAVDGIISDDENIIINDGVVLTLASDFTLAADADQNGTGAIQMAQTSEIVGGGYNLTLKASGSSTIGKVTGVKDLALYSQNGNATYQVRNAVTLSGNLMVDTNVTLTGGYSVTVGGGSVTGDGTINMAGGTFTVIGSGSFGGSQDWTFNELVFGDGTNEGTTSKSGANDVLVVGELKIRNNHRLEAGDDIWNLSWAGGYLKDIIQIAAGSLHMLALTSLGKVLAWGSNEYYQLGNETMSSSSTPIEVSGLENISQIAAGFYHSMALVGSGVDAGEVRAWGRNDYGQLGDGTTTNSSTPVAVIGVGENVGGVHLQDIIQISAGGYHALALTETGEVRTWGRNDYGQLGDGTTTNSSTPVAVIGVGESAGGAHLQDIIQISAGGYHALALTETGEVRAWGSNSSGQLGDGTTAYRSTPVAVLDVGASVGGAHLTNISQVAAGNSHSLALIGSGDYAGEVRAWGGNGDGQIGDGTARTSARLVPVPVLGVGQAIGGNHLKNVIQIVVGLSHSLALISEQDPDYAGAVLGWGSNLYGQIGSITLGTKISVPKEVVGLTNITQIAGGKEFSVGLIGSGDHAGEVRAWGSGWLGDNSYSISTTEPVAVLSGKLGGVELTGITQVAAGLSHTLALSGADGLVYSWGSNYFGQLGHGDTEDSWTPELVLSEEGTDYLRGITQIAAGYAYSLALTGAGEVCSWGQNSYGQLGDGTTTSRLRPVAVLGLTNITQIAASQEGYHSLALTDTGEVWAWGGNAFGQLGDGTTTDRWTPVATLSVGASVGGTPLTQITQISAGRYHSLALTETGEVRAWGRNEYGQLGDGTTAYRSTPVAVLDVGASVGGAHLTNVSQIAAGFGHSLALIGSGDYEGEVRAWGNNRYGQLGDGTMTSRSSPVAVLGMGESVGGAHLTNINKIAAGEAHSLAIIGSGVGAGEIRAWGYNAYGELGDGTTTDRWTPVATLNVGESVGGAHLTAIGDIAAGGSYSLGRIGSGSDAGKLRAWGYNYIGQLGNGSADDQMTPDEVVRSAHAPFVTELGAYFDAQYSTFQYLGDFAFGGVVMIAPVQYYNLTLGNELKDYALRSDPSKSARTPTLGELDLITGGDLKVLGEAKPMPQIDLEEVQAKFEEEMKRQEEEAKNGNGEGLLAFRFRPDARMQHYDPFRNPPNIIKLFTDVQVSEGAVYVVDRASGMDLLREGESRRVGFNPVPERPSPAVVPSAETPSVPAAQTAPVPTPLFSAETAPVSEAAAVPDMKEAIDRSSGGYATLVNPDKDVFVRCPGGEWQAAKHDMVILPGDEVRTVQGAEAKVLLQGGDVGQVEVKGGSLFRITKAETNPKTGDRTTLLDLAIGKVLVHAQKLKGGSKFEVRTPTALTGVRGTTFTVEVKEKA